jgi:DNA-binding SARP family transcriptional activator
MLRVRLLGGLDAECAGRPLRLPTRKVAGLLALLAFRPEAALPRARLAAMLWPDSDEAASRTSLRQALAALRRELGDLLHVAGDAVFLEAESDVARLEAALAAGDVLAAAALHAGTLLDGLDLGAEPFEEWRRAEAARLRNRLMAALTTAMAAAGNGQPHAEALLRLDPAAEEAHQALIRLHLGRGALGAAMRQYETCREALARDLGVAPSPGTEALRRRIRAPRPAEDETRPTLAVLPFTDLSEDAADAWFAPALAEDLTAELGRFRVLRVIAAASVIAVRPHAASPREAAERLGARYLLTGSLRRGAAQVRLAADLTDALEGRHLWSQRLDLPLAGLQAATDELVSAVAGSLAKRLEHDLVQEARAKPAADLAAWECWLRGLSLLRSGQAPQQAEAEALFTRALALDPGFARAEAGLSLVQFNEWSCMAWDQWDERERRAHDHALRAVELDAADSLAHFILGRVLLYRRDFARGEHHLQRAEALNPNDADMQTQMALAHCILGRPDRAQQAADLAARLNPFHDDWYYAYAAMPPFCRGDYAGAIELGRRAPEIAADMDAYRAAAEAHLGQVAAARGSLGRFLLRFRERITFGRDPAPGEPARWLALVNPFRRPEDLARLLDGVRLAGLEVPDDLHEPSPRLDSRPARH